MSADNGFGNMTHPVQAAFAQAAAKCIERQFAFQGEGCTVTGITHRAWWVIKIATAIF